MENEKKKAAIYICLSGGIDVGEMIESQVSYYTGLVSSNSEWEFGGLYIDVIEKCAPGQQRNRDSLNNLIQDASDGKFDIIIVKSLSRFVRKSNELFVLLRKLKKANVDVFCEEDNVWLSDSILEMFFNLGRLSDLKIHK